MKRKIILITGASSGIGRATAIEFAKKGAIIILAARRIEKLHEIKNSLLHINKNIYPIKVDVTKNKEVKDLFNFIENKFQGIHVLINNAGIGLHSKIQNISEETWENIHDVNVKGVFLCTKESIRIMRKSGIKGHIITVSSIAGLYGAPEYSAYCSSKHAVTGFKRSLRLELWREGIKVSTIFPARINTEFFNNYVKKPQPWQMLSPKDIGEYIVAIASRKITLNYYYKIRNFIKRIINTTYGK